jgi:enoyl-CoA hydratase/carnithine racemase
MVMGDLMEYRTVIVTHDGPILRVTLNRPERLNAFNEEMFREVSEIAEVASKNPDMRAVVFEGAGRAFCSGADLGDIVERNQEVARDALVARIREAQIVFDKVEEIPRPTIAAINGYALGAGLQLALACDFRIAVRGIRLGLTDVKNGIVPALGATTRLPRLIGLARSKELILLGDLIDPEVALGMGLVHQTVERDHLDHAVRQLCEKILTGAPLAQGSAKELLNSNASLEQVAEVQSRLFKTADAFEGMRAFLEKRKPVFTGS